MTDGNPNARLEAFCDGVFAIALTLLIIDIKIPDMEKIGSSAELWRAFQQLAPIMLAFLLSFSIILVTWVNHHAALSMVGKSSPAFMYANGFLLLSVVFIPFPTALLGAFIGTDHAAPAVVFYDAVLAVQALGWIAVTGSALKRNLIRDEQWLPRMRADNRNGYAAFAFYAGLAVVAFWYPVSVAVVTMVSWIGWLAVGVRLKALPVPSLARIAERLE